jgi:hypothetical protein
VRSSIFLRRWLEREKLLPDFKNREAVAGQDVGGGKSKSVFVDRRGPLVGMPSAWTDNDGMDIAMRALELCTERRCKAIKYDAIGVGQSVSTGFRHIRNKVDVQAINVGAHATRTLWPDGKTARDKFSNLKAELWWVMRDRLRKTHEHWLFTQGSSLGTCHDVDELLLLPDSPELKMQLSQPKYGSTESGKIQIESKTKLRTRGIESPDYAEALMLSFAPKPHRVSYGRSWGNF